MSMPSKESLSCFQPRCGCCGLGACTATADPSAKTTEQRLRELHGSHRSSGLLVSTIRLDTGQAPGSRIPAVLGQRGVVGYFAALDWPSPTRTTSASASASAVLSGQGSHCPATRDSTAAARESEEKPGRLSIYPPLGLASLSTQMAVCFLRSAFSGSETSLAL
jgi:hypothetical protein